MTVIDANANVGPALYGDFEIEPTLAALRGRMDACGIDEAVVAPLKPPSFDFDDANRRLAERLDGHDDLHGIARVDPRVEDARQHAERAIDDYGLGGIKLHPWEETFRVTDAAVEPVAGVAADRGVPLWIHAGYPHVSHALTVREFARAFPDLPLVLTHGGQLDISGRSTADAKLLAETTANTHFELSGVYRQDFIEELVEICGPDRVVFGTNAPYFRPRVEISRVEQHPWLDDATKAALLGESIRALLA